MFEFFKKRKNEVIDKDDEKLEKKDSIILGTGYSVTESATESTRMAAQKFAKSNEYNRNLIDDSAAKKNIKTEIFYAHVEVKDPYTGDILKLTKAEAKLKYGKDWAKHLAEADHIVPLKKRHEQTQNNAWLTNDDVKKSSNSKFNLKVISRKFNNAKRSKSNKELVEDESYLEKTGLKLSQSSKNKAIEIEKEAQKALKKQDLKDVTHNIMKTGHGAGKSAAKNAGITGLTMSGIMNMTAVIKGEKSAEDAIIDVVTDGGRAAATGYMMGGGLTTICHTFSNSSSKFLKALSASNVPGKVITAVAVTGNTLKRYGDGEISTQECLLELGEKGLNVATTGYAMAVGQAVIPIPIVGAAVGALVGSVVTQNYYNHLMIMLTNNELEHQERLRIIEECEKATKEMQRFREELELYLENYFYEYNDCFDEALSTMHKAFEKGDANGVISGANQITRKLGGKVYYDNMDEFKDFLFDDATDIL